MKEKQKDTKKEQLTHENQAEDRHEPLSVLEKLAVPLPELGEQVETPKDVHGEELLDETIVEEEYTKAAEREKPKSKKKSIIFSAIFLTLNIAFVAFLVRSLLRSADSSIVDLFKAQGKKLWWLVLAFGLLSVTFVFDAAAFSILIKKITGKWRPWLSYKTTSMGKYYESLTPFAIGMQPGQIVELSKGRVAPGIATSIPIMRMIVYNILNVLLSIGFLIGIGSQIGNVVVLKEGARILLIIFEVFAYIGIVISSAKIIIVILIANSKMVGRSLARFVVRVGYKLRFVKDYRRSYNKLMRTVLEFQNSMNYFKKHKWILLGCVGCLIVSLLALASLPFAITLALSDIQIVSFKSGLWIWAESVARYYICFNAASYIPLPGGTGMIEIAFIAMFGNSRFLPTQAQYVYGFLIWRVISYYLVIAQGMVMMVIDSARTMIPARRKKKEIVQKKID